MKKLFYLLICLLCFNCNKRITHHGNVWYDPNAKQQTNVNNDYDDSVIKASSPYIETAPTNTYNQQRSYSFSNNGNSQEQQLNMALNNINKNTTQSTLANKQPSQVELSDRQDFLNTQPKQPAKIEQPKREQKSWSVQCGVYTNANTAQSLAEDLKDRGLQNVRVITENGKHKILVGSFANKTEGSTVRNQIEQTGLVSGAFWVYK